MAKKSQHTLIYGQIADFPDYPFSVLMVVILDDRLVAWGYSGGMMTREVQDLNERQEFPYIENSLAEKITAEFLALTLGVELIEINIEPVEAQEHWTFKNLAAQNYKWVPYDFADLVNKRVTGKLVTRW